MIAADPHQGGATWAVLQWVLGLRALGHDVWLVDPMAPGSLRPGGGRLHDSINARYFQAVADAFDLRDRAALLLQGTHETVGVSYRALLEHATRSDVLINISGLLTDHGLRDPVPCRVYLDLDPGFVQLWHAAEGIDMRFDGHTHFVTIGQAVGRADCGIPTCGRSWLHTLQPIALTEWPVTCGNARAAWTTVGSWRGYGSIQYGGVFYGQKAHSLRRLIDLPLRTRETLCPALAIDRREVKDLDALRTHGWLLTDPALSTDTPYRYGQFIRASKGEIGIAKSGYVESRCGWFSDRSVCYLASGRPVVAQETGFSRVLPTGEGLWGFNTAEEAAAALDDVSRDYQWHCRRAREIAEEYFRSDLVLTRLLESIA